MIPLLAVTVLTLILVGWWIYDWAWQRGYRYGYSAGLIANDRVNITWETDQTAFGKGFSEDLAEWDVTLNDDLEEDGYDH